MFCLTSVCLFVAYIGPKSRTERPRKTKIGTEVAYVTCDSDTTFNVKRSKVKGQGHQAALLTAVLARQAAAAVSVGRVGRGKLLLEPLRRPRERRVAGHIMAAARLQLVTSAKEVLFLPLLVCPLAR